jgi:hypothetical protein
VAFGRYSKLSAKDGAARISAFHHRPARVKHFAERTGEKADITGTSVNFGFRKTTSVKQMERAMWWGDSQRAAFFDPEGA